MSTDAQFRANRDNATRSTGPKSKNGKATSSTNALKHGGYASRPTAIPRGDFVEDEAEVTGYIEELVTSLRPRDSIERETAYRIGTLYLRLRRLSRLESEAIAGDAPTRTDYVGPSEFDDGPDARREQGALRALQQSVNLVTVIDQRTATALQKALDAYEILQRRDLSATEGDAT